MDAERFAARRGVEPRSLALAIGINGAVLLAIATASPELVKRITDHPIDTYQVPIPPQPKPIPKPEPRTDPAPRQHITIMKPLVDPLPHPQDPPMPRADPLPQPQPTGTAATGTGDGTAATPTPPLIAASIDPRYVDGLQPPYPPTARRESLEGRVVVRVLVGTDGRVAQIELVSATDDDFWVVTKRQALARWRFRPATRGGVPEASWRQMTVTFRLGDEG